MILAMQRAKQLLCIWGIDSLHFDGMALGMFHSIFKFGQNQLLLCGNSNNLPSLTVHNHDLALYVFRQHFFQHPSCWLSVHVFGCLTIWICKLPIVPEQGEGCSLDYQHMSRDPRIQVARHEVSEGNCHGMSTARSQYSKIKLGQQ